MVSDYSNRADCNVTLKIVVAEKSSEIDRELRILTYLDENRETSHPGYKHVAHLLDSFYHIGPNGRHLCLVFNVLGPSIAYFTNCGPNYRLDGSLARNVAAQLLLAVDYLHSSGIAHGGELIFILNVILVADLLEKIFTWATSYSTIQNWRVFHLRSSANPQLAMWRGEMGYLPRKACQIIWFDLSTSVLSIPVAYARYNWSILESVSPLFGQSLLRHRILSSGPLAFFCSHPPKCISTPTSFRPPEVVFKLGLTNAVDIWNLGCTVSIQAHFLESHWGFE